MVRGEPQLIETLSVLTPIEPTPAAASQALDDESRRAFGIIQTPDSQKEHQGTTALRFFKADVYDARRAPQSPAVLIDCGAQLHGI
jgi:hypothetical protein